MKWYMCLGNSVRSQTDGVVVWRTHHSSGVADLDFYNRKELVEVWAFLLDVPTANSHFKGGIVESPLTLLLQPIITLTSRGYCC